MDPVNRGLTKVIYCVTGDILYWAVSYIKPIFQKSSTSHLIFILRCFVRRGVEIHGCRRYIFLAFLPGPCVRALSPDRDGTQSGVWES